MRRLIPTLSIVLAVALVGGCGTKSDDSAKPDATASAPSKLEPVAAVKQGMDRSLSGTLSMQASIKAGSQSMTLGGKMDPVAKAIQISGKAPEPIEVRMLDNTAYIKSESMEGEKPWMKIDLGKLKPTSTLRQSFDVKSQTGLIGGTVSAQEVGEGRYTGVADLNKAAEVASTEAGMREGLESTAKLAKDPKAIPFEATLDADGRLTTLSYTIATKSLGDLVTEMRMSEFGKPVTVEAPPAGETEAAADEMYAFL
ncbi:hypothetical protein AB0C01_22905 [Micromonospora sp. NPDC048905]|uniref:hypothetical protein n=1 Tax=Micromonospora sp. NPDC048905 TaxID=3155494 RepID=UPI0033EC6173